MQAYRYEQIVLGSRELRLGHMVYPDAIYVSRAHPTARRVVYKENKHNNPDLSRFEVAFGTLARLFLDSDLAPKSRLVKNTADEVVGLACEHLSYDIARREDVNQTFYRFAAEGGRLTWTSSCPEFAEAIPFHFFSQFPPGYFNTLYQAHTRGEIELDMESLASVLATSYTLEEDDLHKGNFGFYVVQKNDKPRVVFFKIDHDLMLADSVMSHCQSRFLNWFLGSDAFKITARDLINFPRLTDSQNYYWPTTSRWFHFNSEHAYTSEVEREAFAQLAQSAEFCAKKWQTFYKHILLPPALIRQQLANDFDMKNADERAKLSLITQSVVARQATLRAVLFTIPEFRQYVLNLNEEASRDLVQGIVGDAAADDVMPWSQEIATVIARHQELCLPEGGFVPGDTPLHAAIRLGDYRYHETWQSFSRYSVEVNAQGQTALDLALALSESREVSTDDLRTNLPATIGHLVHEGATTNAMTLSVRQVSLQTDYLSSSPYLAQVQTVTDSAGLKCLLRAIGEEHRYSLKTQKELAVLCIRQFIDIHKHNPQLKKYLLDLKTDLNGTADKRPAPELQYIRQLRSQLWIIRIIRGLFGGTATKVMLNQLINHELQRLTKSSSCSSSFFAQKEPPSTEKNQPDDELGHQITPLAPE
ncbi:Dot/Icm T4SS effector AnkK/LegA5 [Legionella nagasakiensis]|uniref:Dot/Icm T4SS effector AnkK/LegA5 n=1 Tax=Legionella nagasakiensis TaxID=535290 RepID=UPI0010561A6A|nr:Dot/Icm T4SS effector AnkK/LegA5 [Legionella nagasakiensis]